jgi:signal transduction histidine kinase
MPTTALVVYRNVSMPFEFLLPFAVFVGAWFLGHVIHMRRHYTGALEERAKRLEVERTESERRAAAAERARIARDLHDIVAHRVSMMTVQAGAARVIADSDPAAAARTIALLEAAGRQTLWELRRLMGVLRDDGEDAAPTTPRPGLGQLEALASDVQAAGVPVRLTLLGDASQVPEAVEVSAYRIVQEALTNVLKHGGPGAEADVIVRCTPSIIEIDINDSGIGASGSRLPGGHGLVGMRERAAVFGGTVRHGPRPEGGYFVSAKLPTLVGEP